MTASASGLSPVSPETAGPGAVVRRVHQAFNDRERHPLLACLDEAVVWHVAGDHQMAMTYTGRDSVWEQYLEPLFPSPFRIGEHAMLEHGGLVVAIVDHIHNWGDGEWRFETIETFRLAGDRIVERWELSPRQAELDGLLRRGCVGSAAAQGMQ